MDLQLPAIGNIDGFWGGSVVLLSAQGPVPCRETWRNMYQLVALIVVQGVCWIEISEQLLYPRHNDCMLRYTNIHLDIQWLKHEILGNV